VPDSRYCGISPSGKRRRTKSAFDIAPGISNLPLVGQWISLRAGKVNRPAPPGRILISPISLSPAEPLISARKGDKTTERPWSHLMDSIKLNKSGVLLSRIIMGTWQAGKQMWSGIDDAESTRAIRAAVEAGATTIDTAEGYGKGHSERIIAAATADIRDRVVYASKVSPNHLKFDQVINACHQSLRNLKTDYLDLFQIHWPAGTFGSPAVPLDETMAGLNRLKKRGKIRAIGVCNFSCAQLKEALRFGDVDTLQIPYSLFWRHAEAEAQSFCRENDIAILAYSPLAQGMLTGRFGPDHTFAPGDHRTKNKLYQPENYARVQQAITALLPIALKKQVTLAQLALAWVLSHPATCAIAGARNAGQSVENVTAFEVRLSDTELAYMDAVSRLVTDHLQDSPLQWDF
jgi:myo-inositol catabolism protein IolS